MIRIVEQEGHLYGIHMKQIDVKEMDNTNIVVSNGKPVLYVNEVKDVRKFGMDPDNITLV